MTSNLRHTCLSFLLPRFLCHWPLVAAGRRRWRGCARKCAENALKSLRIDDRSDGRVLTLGRPRSPQTGAQIAENGLYIEDFDDLSRYPLR